MHLAEMSALRTTPGAGVFLALTRRCPLSCAHCSTDSALDSEQHAETPFRRLVESFVADDRPDVMCLSGGEALLRAGLVRDLARTARPAGTATYLLSGMYFARDGRAMPTAVRDAIAEVDHFAASLDEFHEREVGRREVFDALHRVRAMGPDVSLQLTGRGEDDPYLAALVDDIRREFDDTVPVLVNHLGAVGRATTWLERKPRRTPSVHESGLAQGISPCDNATWPLVHFDGTVFACCQQDLIARTRPAHLVLGHAATDGWPVLHERFLASPVLRGVRTFGPVHLAARAGTSPTGDYCGDCVALSAGDAPARVGAYLDSASGRRMERALDVLLAGDGVSSYAERRSGRYGDLVRLGAEDARA